MSEYVVQQTVVGHWGWSLSWPGLSDVLHRLPQVEEKPDVTYSDVGGCKEQIEKLREVVETPLLHVSDRGLTSAPVCEDALSCCAATTNVAV